MRPKAANVYITLTLIFLYLPIAAVILYSFNASKNGLVWGGFSLDWYAALFSDRKLTAAFWISAQVAAASAALSCVAGTAAALAANAMGARLKLLFGGIMYIPIIIPEIVMAAALLMFFGFLGTGYGIWTLVISHSIFCTPYVFVLTGIRLRSIDKSITEAALDLGAKPSYAFFTVVFPLIMPAVISGALLSLAMSFDDVVISMFVSGPRSQTLPVTVYSMLRLGVTPKINALYTLIFSVSFAALSCVKLLFAKQIKEE